MFVSCLYNPALVINELETSILQTAVRVYISRSKTFETFQKALSSGTPKYGNNKIILENTLRRKIYPRNE